MIEINQLQVIRNGKPICQVEHLAAPARAHLAVIGPNGSGKTTLLRVLAGLTSDFQGQCKIAAERRQRTYVHQQPFLFRRSVLSNIRYGQQGRSGLSASAEQWLDQLGVGALANRLTKNLSAGEIRRVALARALACEPQLLILDEPFVDLDTQATSTVCRILNELQNTTVVVASPVPLPTDFDHQLFTMPIEPGLKNQSQRAQSSPR